LGVGRLNGEQRTVAMDGSSDQTIWEGAFGSSSGMDAQFEALKEQGVNEQGGDALQSASDRRG